MKIYIIQGSSGNYPDDAQYWIVCAYSNKDTAIEHVNKLKIEVKEREELENRARQACRRVQEYGEAYKELLRVRELALLSDPFIPFERDGTQYEIIETELKQ